MREIRTLRAMRRALETGPRRILNGHEEGNLGYKPRRNLRATAPALDPTSIDGASQLCLVDKIEAGQESRRRSGLSLLPWPSGRRRARGGE